MIWAVLVAMVVVGAVGHPVQPSFRFSYTDPDQKQVSQFYAGPTNDFLYNWGYTFPGQSHTEVKSHNGAVSGQYAYVDANGVSQRATYRSSPGFGFTVDRTPKVVDVESFPAVKTAVVPALPLRPQPIKESYSFKDEVTVEELDDQYTFRLLADKSVGLDTGSIQTIEKASSSVLAAVRSGLLVPVGGYTNEIVFRVNDDVVRRAEGSHSVLASILDVDLIAARHDQQRPPGEGFFYSAAERKAQHEVRGVLDTEIFSDGEHFIVRMANPL